MVAVVERFSITFSDPMYFPDQTVKGYVKLTLGKDLKIRKLTVRPKGRCHVFWEEGKRKSKHERGTDTLKLYQELVSSTDILLIPRGEHTYPFEIDLPNGIPESKHVQGQGFQGEVRYEVEAELVIPWSSNKKTVGSFCLLGILDLNMSKYKSPAFNFGNITYGRYCFESKPLEVALKLEKNGYFVGETVSAIIEVTNSSGKEVLLRLDLIQQCNTFNGKVWSKSVESTPIGQSVQGNDKATIACSVPIPPCPVTSWNPSDPLRISYFIKAQIEPDSLVGDTLTVQVPITIGNIPFKESINSLSRLVEGAQIAFPEKYQEMKLNYVASTKFEEGHCRYLFFKPEF